MHFHRWSHVGKHWLWLTESPHQQHCLPVGLLAVLLCKEKKRVVKKPPGPGRAFCHLSRYNMDGNVLDSAPSPAFSSIVCLYIYFRVPSEHVEPNRNPTFLVILACFLRFEAPRTIDTQKLITCAHNAVLEPRLGRAKGHGSCQGRITGTEPPDRTNDDRTEFD